MYVHNATLDDVNAAIALVSRDCYGGNVIRKNGTDKTNSRGGRCAFTLRVTDSRSRGAKRSWSGRRGVSACWHVHYDVLAELFRTHPDARVTTALAKYTAATFTAAAWATANLNVGSQVAPVRSPDLCECDHDEYVSRYAPEDFREVALVPMYSAVDYDSEPSGDAVRPDTSVEYFLRTLDRVLSIENAERA